MHDFDNRLNLSGVSLGVRKPRCAPGTDKEREEDARELKQQQRFLRQMRRRQERFEFYAAAGINLPDLDLFLALYRGDPEAEDAALRRGASPAASYKRVNWICNITLRRRLARA